MAAIEPPPHTVIILQGNASLAPPLWKVRTVSCHEAGVSAAVATAGRRDATKKAMLSVIVRGTGHIAPGQRAREHARLRAPVLAMRVPVQQLVHSGRLPAAVLPVVVEIPYEATLERGALAKAMDERVDELIIQAPPQQPQQGQDQPPGPSNPQKSLKAKGRQYWMGKAVLKFKAVGKVKPAPRLPFPSKAVVKILKPKLPRTMRRHVRLQALTKDDGDRYQLPTDGSPGAPPVIVGKIKDKEIGGVNVLEVERDSEAPPNLGSVFIDGNVTKDVENSLRVAQTFVLLHSGWISDYLGKAAVRDPATSNVKLHILSTLDTKQGTSAGAAFVVTLVHWYWDVTPCTEQLAVTGEATLSGPVSGVGGLQAKALAAFNALAKPVPTAAEATPDLDACLIIPAENTSSGLVIENESMFDAGAAAPVDVPAGVARRVHTFAVRTLFDLIALCYPIAKKPAHKVKAPRPQSILRLSVAKTFMTYADGGVCQAIEVALLENGSGKRIYTHDVKPVCKDAIEAGLTWLLERWEDDVESKYKAYYKPHDRNYDLHFNIPDDLAENLSSVSCSAVLGVLSVLLRKPLPDHVVVMAESKLDGGLFPPRALDMTDGTILSLAKANGVTKLLTTEEGAISLRATAQKRPKQLNGVEVISVSDMVEVMEAVWH